MSAPPRLPLALALTTSACGGGDTHPAPVRRGAGGPVPVVVAARFKEGEHVEAGQTLFIIDPRPYQIAVDAAKARLARDQAQLRAAELDAARYRKLSADKIASAQRVESTQADAATLRATIAGAELALAFTDVKAPVDFAIEARADGKSPLEAIHEACRVRFRPITMTTMAALVGTLPIALGYGAGAESRRPLGLAVVGGLIFSQILTLYVTPVFYLVMEDLRLFLSRRLRVARTPGEVTP